MKTNKYLSLLKHLCTLPNFDNFVPLRGTRFTQIKDESSLENGIMKMPAEDTAKEAFIEYVENKNFNRAKECYLVYQAFCESLNEEICFLAIPSFIHNLDKETNQYQLKPDVNKSILFNTKFLEHESKATPERVLGNEDRYINFCHEKSPPLTDDWAVWHSYAMELCEAVTSGLLNSLPGTLQAATDNHYKVYAMLYKENGADRKALGNILDLYDDLIIRGENAYNNSPLAHVIAAHDGLPQSKIHHTDTLVEDIQSQPFLLGHMDEQASKNLRSLSDRSLFPLDNSQRFALSKICSMPSGCALAVNGPPGSGKTAMLKAVIAHHWVNAAVNKEVCPIIIAVGATNQSVTNIIDAFPSVLYHGEDVAKRLIHIKRWIGPVPHSYGTFFPSKSKSDELEKEGKLNNYVIAKESATNDPSVFKWIGKCEILSNIEQFDHFVNMYSDHATKCFGAELKLESIIDECHKRLVGITEQISDIITRGRRLELTNLEKTLTILVPIAQENGTGGFRAQAKDIADKIRTLLNSNTGIAVNSQNAIITEVIREKILDEGIILENVERNVFSKLWEDAIHILMDQLIDVTLRADAFHWAARYWEGIFLLESKNSLLISRSESNVEEGLRRLCMLTPCLVSTLHSVPKLFSLDSTRSTSPRRFLLGKADLMIMDESGQAQQRLGMPLLSLCKKALVVGDVDQLQPVITDISLAEEANSYALFNYTKAQFANAYSLKMTTVNGSMLSTLRLSSYASYQGYGLMLRGHYRCQSNIIQFCNEMVYDNKLMLLPFNNLERGPLPSVSWVHSDYDNGKDGSSRYSNGEAELVADFVYSQWERIYSFYKKQNEQKNKAVFCASSLIAIVTPFRAQVTRLKDALRNIVEKKGAKEGLTISEVADLIIGTVDSLQGAEMPIVLFSGVHGAKEKAEPYFKDQPFLLNVAMSRAKDCFVAFLCETTYGINNNHKISDLKLLRDDSVKYLGYYLGAATYPNGQRRCVRLFPKRLVIIEAPGKKNSISEYLGPEYEVICTHGSITEANYENLTFDNLIKLGFKLKYLLKSNGRQLIDAIYAKAVNFNEIILATDDDYVGETIAWHIWMQFRNAPEIQRKMTRVRLRAINALEIQSAFGVHATQQYDSEVRALSAKDAVEYTRAYFELRGKIDKQLVKAELFRELIDAIVRIQCRTELHHTPIIENEKRELSSLLKIDHAQEKKQVVGLGRVRLGILHILIHELEMRARQKKSTAIEPRVIVCNREIVGALSSAEPIHKNDMVRVMRSYLSKNDTGFLAGNTEKWRFTYKKDSVSDIPAPTGATIEVIKYAYNSLNFLPEKTVKILQALYEGDF
jgi:hypothetical protein